MKEKKSKAQRLRSRKIWLICSGIVLLLLIAGALLWYFLRPIPIESIRFSATSLTIKAGESSTLYYTYAPENATKTRVEFQSSSPSVAKVQNGILTAVAEGSCYISITAESGVSNYIPVIVEAPLVEKESLLVGSWVIFARKEPEKELRYVYNESSTLTLTEDRTGVLQLKKESFAITDWRHKDTISGYELFSVVQEKSRDQSFYYCIDPASAYNGSLIVELPSGELLLFRKIREKE